MFILASLTYKVKTRNDYLVTYVSRNLSGCPLRSRKVGYVYGLSLDFPLNIRTVENTCTAPQISGNKVIPFSVIVIHNPWGVESVKFNADRVKNIGARI